VKRLDDRARSEPARHCGVPERDPEVDGRRSHLREGWYWGSEPFAERMKKLAEGVPTKVKLRKTKMDRDRRPHGEEQARRLVKEGMAVAGLTEADMKAFPGSELRKVAIAKVVWEQTTVGLPWISERLHMRSRTNASQQIRRHRLEPPRLPKALQPRLKLCLFAGISSPRGNGIGNRNGRQ
jgi:putative transposase